MSTPVFVGVLQTDRIGPEQKFRVTFSQGAIEHWLAGGTIQSVYRALSISPWCYVVSEPPIDDSPVMVVDLRISQGTSGSSPPGSVAELVNSLEDLTFYNAYEVTRVERLTTTAPILEQRSQVIDQALVDAQKSGVAGLVRGVKGVVGGVTSAVGKVFSNVKTVALVVALGAAIVATVYVVRATRAAKAA